jgi:hypothetical protein
MLKWLASWPLNLRKAGVWGKKKLSARPQKKSTNLKSHGLMLDELFCILSW